MTSYCEEFTKALRVSMTERLGDEEQGDFARDGSVDLKGNPVRRSERGGWKACSFLVGKHSCLN